MQTHCIILYHIVMMFEETSPFSMAASCNLQARKLLRSLNGRVGAPDETLRLPPKDIVCDPLYRGNCFLHDPQRVA